MAKPIFLIQLNNNIRQDDLVRTREAIEKKLTDWHVLVAATAVEEPTFTVFSDKQADDIEIENLKQMLLNQFK
jgi:hypothetical protein